MNHSRVYRTRAYACMYWISAVNIGFLLINMDMNDSIWIRKKRIDIHVEIN